MSLYIPMVIISIIGIIMAIILIIINNKFDYRRIIQHSHPSCNNLILMGNILCLLATIPLGFNTKLVTKLCRYRAISLVNLNVWVVGGGGWWVTTNFNVSSRQGFKL